MLLLINRYLVREISDFSRHLVTVLQVNLAYHLIVAKHPHNPLV